MYLVLSALTSSPISLVAATKASAFSFRVWIYNDKKKWNQKNMTECDKGRGNIGRKAIQAAEKPHNL